MSNVNKEKSSASAWTSQVKENREKSQNFWKIEENCNNAAQDQNIFGLETKDS